MPEALLTIDDSPSSQTGALTSFLKSRNISAILFCRGDNLEKNPDAAAQAVLDGFVLGNHAYSHTRFSTLTFEQGVEEIRKTETLINDVYKDAGVERPAKYFRFPHMDRGCGGWVVDYDAVPRHREALVRLFAEGLNISLTPPDAAMVEKKKKLQNFLWAEGFKRLPLTPLFPWFAETEMMEAVDAMFTYSTSDWMVTPRHAGKWQYKTVADLTAKIDADPWLARPGRHIILAHDQPDLLETVKTLVIYLQEKGFTFI